MSKDIKLSSIIEDLDPSVSTTAHEIELVRCAILADDLERATELAIKALSDIRRHQEAINPHAMGMSPAWVIANRALEQLESE